MSAYHPFLQIQSAAPLWLVSVSYHCCINGPWPFFQLLSQTLSASLRPQLTPPLHESLNHTWAGPLVLFISCPSLHRLQISLSILCHLSSSTPLALLSVCCPVCHTCAVSFCLPDPHLYLLHLLPLNITVFTAFFYVYAVSSSFLQNQSS